MTVQSVIASYENRMLMASTDRLTLDGVGAARLSVTDGSAHTDSAPLSERRVAVRRAADMS
jgi:hypothetical protein